MNFAFFFPSPSLVTWLMAFLSTSGEQVRRCCIFTFPESGTAGSSEMLFSPPTPLLRAVLLHEQFTAWGALCFRCCSCRGFPESDKIIHLLLLPPTQRYQILQVIPSIAAEATAGKVYVYRLYLLCLLASRIFASSICFENWKLSSVSLFIFSGQIPEDARLILA